MERKNRYSVSTNYNKLYKLFIRKINQFAVLKQLQIKNKISMLDILRYVLQWVTTNCEICGSCGHIKQVTKCGNQFTMLWLCIIRNDYVISNFVLLCFFLLHLRIDLTVIYLIEIKVQNEGTHIIFLIYNQFIAGWLTIYE